MSRFSLERFGLSPTPTRVTTPRSTDFGETLPVRSGVAGLSPSERRYNILSGDPYEQVARQQQEMGRRLPHSFDAPSAQRGRKSLSGKLARSSHVDLHGDHAVVNAGSVAGMRETMSGAFGSPSSDPYNWDARHRFGYGQLGVRGSGYSDRWDSAHGKERTAGRLTTTGAFDQAVRPDRPYLQLRARSDSDNGPVVMPEGSYEGNALVRVTAGNFEDGQGAQRRTFWIGGGLVAVFDLMGWNNVKINVLQILAGTYVEFAWTREGLHGDNRTLYFPDLYTTEAGSSPVPEGAYAVVIENPTPAVGGNTATLEWTGRINGAPRTFTQTVSDNAQMGVGVARPYAFYGSPIQVLAPTFRITHGAVTDFELIWMLRPI